MHTAEINKAWLERKLICCIKSFFKNERQLLEDELCERAVTFRLGAKMIKCFQPADVYAEYNKRHDASGCTLAKSLGSSQATSYPDLLVFSNDPEDLHPNKLVIEVKLDYQNPSGQDIQHDKDKLMYFTNQDNEYKYIIGGHLLLGTNFFVIAYFENGNLSEIERYDRSEESSWEKITVSCPHDYKNIAEFRVFSNGGDET